MDPDIRQTLTAWLERESLDAVLLTAPASVDWASGHEISIETGHNPFAGGPNVLLVERDRATLLHPDCEAPDCAALQLTGLAYASYTPDDSFAPSRHYRETFKELIAGQANLGVELNTLPADLADLFGAAQRVDGQLDPLRMVKTPRELAAIRRSLDLCDHAQAILPGIVRPGRSEMEMWGELRTALEARAGCRLPFICDFVSGPRTGDIGGPPNNRQIVAGEWILADIVPRLGNYWGDICNVIPVGEPTARYRELKKIASDALDFATSLIKPGAIAGEIDRQVRDFISRAGYPPYPHHTGHGLGVCYHEAPRIVTGDNTPLAENMVIALEPGVYFPGECGVRMEDIMRVTATGAEVLTKHRQS